MLLLKLKTLHLQCGGCPTVYTGETKKGQRFEAYLRYGTLQFSLDGEDVFVHHTNDDLLGFMTFHEIKEIAESYGVFIDNTNAEETSFADEMEEFFKSFHKKVKMIVHVSDRLQKDKVYQYNKATCDYLVEHGVAVYINDDEDEDND